MGAQSTRPAPRRAADVPANRNRFLASDPNDPAQVVDGPFDAMVELTSNTVNEEIGRLGSHPEPVEAWRGHQFRLHPLAGPCIEEEQTCP